MSGITLNNGTTIMNLGFLFTGLTLIFTYLKLTAAIDWSWWLVLLPTYGPLTLIGAIWALFVVLSVWVNK